MNPSPQQTFLDPYSGEPKKVRLQTWVSEEDHDFVMSIRPGKGTIQVINNTLWSKFIQSIQNYGITSITDKAKLEQFVAGFIIELPQGCKLPRRTSNRDKRKAT